LIYDLYNNLLNDNRIDERNLIIYDINIRQRINDKRRRCQHLLLSCV
jgi:hypothetical protein